MLYNALLEIESTHYRHTDQQTYIPKFSDSIFECINFTHEIEEKKHLEKFLVFD